MATSIYEFAQLPRLEAGPGRTRRARRVRAAGETPVVGVIYNPRSHRNRGADLDCSISPHVHIAQPGDRSQLLEALADLAARDIDLLVINGGDGTVRDVLTCGAALFGESWPPIAVLPKGKTNALTIDLGVPKDWSLQAAIEALDSGGIVRRRPMAIESLDDPGTSPVHGFIFGAGAFTTATRAGQVSHRLGAFNSLAVGATALWALAQSVFATRNNPWRKGARMAIRLGANGAPMAHSGKGDPAFRQALFASTLERLPAGLVPFGKLRHGLKLVAVDQISRRTTLSVPAIMRGYGVAGLRERGIHQIAAAQFTLDIEDQFILDGEAFPAGRYRIGQGPELEFVTP
ncbi:diacylglycerol kinase family protein [Erythrobacter sp. HL-111]|uniref:diacylglycerol/lipid kinase family protein n=1 Tax=Erythrobacter sp. HL-111 TaxID=1798193 RepID=UPI0006DA7DFB|nr:acylglycerol kinase family protein [Erythrobacter sp. HL-111]KPP83857.1 MAG: Sphingosine kinase-like protein [Erythrobacteraceae bacterium HL-111]SDS79930.1 Diacylglycerol kinase catalytic domain-containing protein [Erythrobacter sp. HL-111]